MIERPGFMPREPAEAYNCQETIRKLTFRKNVLCFVKYFDSQDNEPDPDRSASRVGARMSCHSLGLMTRVYGGDSWGMVSCELCRECNRQLRGFHALPIRRRALSASLIGLHRVDAD